MLKRPPASPPSPAREAGCDALSKNEGTVRTVTAKYPGHVWNVDLTTVPIAGGFWVSWIAQALPQCWPFSWWVGFVLDHFSRRVVGFSVFFKQPTGQPVSEMLERAVERVGQAPKYTVTDQGPQFWSEYLAWCERHGVKPRYGAVGQKVTRASSQEVLAGSVTSREPPPARGTPALPRLGDGSRTETGGLR